MRNSNRKPTPEGLSHCQPVRLLPAEVLPDRWLTQPVPRVRSSGSPGAPLRVAAFPPLSSGGLPKLPPRSTSPFQARPPPGAFAPLESSGGPRRRRARRGAKDTHRRSSGPHSAPRGAAGRAASAIGPSGPGAGAWAAAGAGRFTSGQRAAGADVEGAGGALAVAGGGARGRRRGQSPPRSHRCKQEHNGASGGRAAAKLGAGAARLTGRPANGRPRAAVGSQWARGGGVPGRG